MQIKLYLLTKDEQQSDQKHLCGCWKNKADKKNVELPFTVNLKFNININNWINNFNKMRVFIKILSTSLIWSKNYLKKDFL